MSCESPVEFQTLVGAVAGTLFVASELLALSKKTKANGIFHLILIYLEKKFRSGDEEPREDIENPFSENAPFL